MFTSRLSDVILSHSSSYSDEEECELIDPVKIRIGGNEYKYKFVLEDTLYDVILGTPWHKDVNPR